MSPAPEPAPLFETVEAGLHARCVAGRGSDVLVAVFSQVRVPVGRFGLSRLFARTRHALLLLNQPSGDWYRGACEAVDESIARALRASGAGRLVLYGSSMGAFGAVAAAARWPAADLLAFAPDFAIGETRSRSARAGLAAVGGEADLAALAGGPRTGRSDLVFGLFDPYDAGVAARLAGAGVAARIVPAASGHEVHDHLYTVNVVRRIVGGFSRDVAGCIGERGLLLPPPDPAVLAAFAAFDAALAAGRTVDPGDVRSLGLDRNPGAAILEADAFAARGDLVAGEAVLARLQRDIDASAALSSLPKRYRKAIPARRVRWLAAAGRAGEAARVADAARRVLGDDASFRLTGDGAAGGTDA